MLLSSFLKLAYLVEQPHAPEEGRGLNRAFPQCPLEMYGMLCWRSVVVCNAVFQNVVKSVGTVLQPGQLYTMAPSCLSR